MQFSSKFKFYSLQTEPKLLPQVEEVTYAEPVLLPQPPNPNKMHPPMGSPKSTLRKPMVMGHHHGGVNSETLFQVSDFHNHTLTHTNSHIQFHIYSSNQTVIILHAAMVFAVVIISAH